MALQIKHADAVGLLKTWYPTSEGFNPKKAAAKLRSLPERLAEDPEAEKPTDKAVLKTLESVIAAADAGEDIEVVAPGNHEANGNGNGNHAKKNGKAPKAEAKGKGKKPAKKVASKPKVEAAAKDKFGSREGTAAAKFNAVLGKKPKKMSELLADAGLEETMYNHANKLVEAGLAVKSAEGYALAAKK